MRFKKDYQKKNFNNPQFPKKTRSRGQRRPVFLFGLGIFLVLIFLLFLSRADFLKIKKVKVQTLSQEINRGVEELVYSQLEKTKWLIFGQDNILLFSKADLKKSITTNYFFKDIKIKKHLFHEIEVIIDHQASGIIWSVNSEQYYLNLDGIAIKKLSADDLNTQKFEDGTELIRAQSATGDYPLIYDKTNNNIELGKPATSDQMVKFVVLLTQALKVESDFIILHYYTDKPFFPEITMVTKEGWEAKFKVDDNPFKQVKLLNSILMQKVKDRDGLEYVDLRFGEKIFYK